jgi:hypothetical protein
MARLGLRGGRGEGGWKEYWGEGCVEPKCGVGEGEVDAEDRLGGEPPVATIRTIERGGEQNAGLSSSLWCTKWGELHPTVEFLLNTPTLIKKLIQGFLLQQLMFSFVQDSNKKAIKGD